MAEVRFGNVEGSGKGREYSCATGQTFYRRGGKFVKLVGGYVKNVASDAATIVGWLETPKDTAGQSYYKTSTTVNEKLFVVYANDENIFEIPNASTSVAATAIGRVARIKDVSGVQKAELTASPTQSALSVVDVDTTNNTLMVKVISGNRQLL